MINFKLTVAAAFAMCSLTVAIAAPVKITSLRVQSSVEPLAIEDRHPQFSWVMEAADENAHFQKAYRIEVLRESDDSVVWDSGKVVSGESVNLPYQGVALQPDMAYTWKLRVWDETDGEHSASSRFETGLMSHKLSAWGGAQWIGSSLCRLDAATHNYFQISTSLQLSGARKASMILGANDFRMSDPFQNTSNIGGENYFRIELDLSKAGGDGAVLNIYRVGYTKGDKPDVPLYSISRKTYPQSNIDELFPSPDGQYLITADVETSNIYFTVDGKELLTEPPKRNRWNMGGFAVGRSTVKVSQATRLQIGPWGRTHDYNAAPCVGSLGFSVPEGSEALFTDYEIRNTGHSEDNPVFGPSLYGIFSGMKGVSVEGNRIRVSGTGEKLQYVDPSHGALPILRTKFLAAKKIAKAKMYVTAMGAYEMFINGARMGEDWFAPGDSQYRETMGYHAYDVTSMLREGENVIGAQLNPGWYTGYMTYTTSNFNFFGDHEALLARLNLTFEDGTEQVIVTDPKTWRLYDDGPIRFGSFFHGESYDAAKEVPGWKEIGFDDSSWGKPSVIKMRDWMDFDFMARYDAPVQVRETLSAIKLMPVHSADTYIYDMGVNMVGVPQIEIPEGVLKAGDKVILRYAEQLYPGLKGDSPEYVKKFGKRGLDIAGRPLYETLRAALGTDFYIAGGSEAVTIRPTTSYRGYQYIQITIPGHGEPLPLENVRGLVLSSDSLPTGAYHAETTDGTTGRLVNQLFSNIQRSQLGNFFTIPTDCPQRNERMGWTGDAQAYTRTATYNSDVRNFFRQWMTALRADQGVGNKTNAPGGIGSTVPTYNQEDDDTFADGTTWSAAVCMVPWQLYNQYGDTQIIEENMETMMDWLSGMDFYDFSPEHPYLSSKASGLADWLAMDNSTPSDLVNNAIYIHMMDLTAKMAEVTGHDDYAQILRTRRDLALKDWNEVYVDPATGKTRAADGKLVHSQASYATPLNFNCFDETNRPKAEEYLAELAANPSASGTGERTYAPYTITTGFSGTPNILPALSRSGRWEEAYRMFTCTDFTSWLYPVTMGATSIWERWNGFEVAFGDKPQNNMNSFNHFALGAVGQWMYEYQLGIKGGEDGGYHDFVLQPTVGPLYKSLEGSYMSNYGPVSVAWTADGKGRMLSYSVTVPANTTATLYLPMEAAAAPSGAEPKGSELHNGVRCLVYRLSPGSYRFE